MSETAPVATSRRPPMRWPERCHKDCPSSKNISPFHTSPGDMEGTAVAYCNWELCWGARLHGHFLSPLQRSRAAAQLDLAWVPTPDTRSTGHMKDGWILMLLVNLSLQWEAKGSMWPFALSCNKNASQRWPAHSVGYTVSWYAEVVGPVSCQGS